MNKLKKQPLPDLKSFRVAALACGLMLCGQALAQPPAIPERLLQASEQAARAQMQISSMMAREIGEQSAESVKKQDTRNLPDYMKQTVRLDFYGPMDEALNRLANDLGWRVVSFGEPVIGGMKPHVYLRDSKPVHQHIAELGSQIPWPLLVDLRNERLVVDYRTSTGTEQQVKLTQKHLDNNRARIEEGNLAKPRALPAETYSSSRAPATPLQPEYPSKNNWTATPLDPTELMYNVDYSGWGVELGAYIDKKDARAMLAWLQERSIDASARIDGGMHRIRLLAVNQSVASTLQQYLLSNGFEGEISYASPEIVQQQLKAQANTAKPQQQTVQQQQETDANWRSKMVAPRTAMEGNSDTASAVKGGRETTIRTTSRHVTMPPIQSTPRGYGVQTITHFDHQKALQIAEDLRNKNYPAFVFKLGKHYGVRVGQLQKREQALNLMVAIRKMGFPDAYVVKANKGV